MSTEDLKKNTDYKEKTEGFSLIYHFWRTCRYVFTATKVHKRHRDCKVNVLGADLEELITRNPGRPRWSLAQEINNIQKQQKERCCQRT
jgi:hypothetical protein